jgi:poly-gamma-glutamate synthesis protein (capsule biosynthesis protein)
MLALGCVLTLLSACGELAPAIQPELPVLTLLPPQAVPTRTPFLPVLDTPPPSTALVGAAPVDPGEGLTIWVPAYYPPALQAGLRLPAVLRQVPEPDGAALRLEVSETNPLAWLVYALVAPFPTIQDGVSFEAVEQAWRGEGSGALASQPLLLDAGTLEVFSVWWGAPAPEAVEALPADEILDTAWAREAAYALIPFDALTPRWKVLAVDGVSPVRKDFEAGVYPLAIPVSLGGDPDLVASVQAVFAPDSEDPLLVPGNRDPEKLTTLVLTGVTALVRATAWTMEIRGVTYPARDIGDWLRAADITHISNEVPFAVNCPPPDPGQEDLRFCSDPRYIALLEDIGTDVVELTGDHFGDWGVAAMEYTLEQYREQDWPYYGGGVNEAEGKQPVLIEHNGNRLAFIGCNGKGRPFAGATTTLPGAVVCDFPFMHAEIARLRQEGYLPIVTFQHFEYYTYAALPNQIADFGGMAEAGAVIVSGSQAHHPQAIAFQDEAFIHYGLGNLFFDQLDVGPGTRLAFIDRHVFYEGRYISTELLTIVFEDYARARPMNPSERQDLLRNTFAASGW